MKYTITKANKDDSQLILDFIKELADYEGMLDKVTAGIDNLNKTLFCKNPKAEVLILREGESDVGFTIYFYNYSTFLCKNGIYIEDIYVRKKFRGKGDGTAFFKYICQKAIKEDCGRVEWWCLDWNKPSIDFYREKLCAEQMSDWTVYRLSSDEIKNIAATNIE